MNPIGILVYALIIGAVYAFLILPKQRQQRSHDAMLASLDEGDEIILNSGIYGFISSADDSVLWVEVAEDIELKVARSAVQGKIVASDSSDEDEDDDDEEDAD